jgi:heterotetrameric sarcosine oxidase gamma subunit
MSADAAVDTTSTLAGLPAAVGSGRGVIATERDGLAIARIAARSGQAARLAQLFRAHFGIEPPNAPRRVARGDVGIAGIAPGVWLATRESGGNAFAESLRPLLDDCASITDQSDAYVILGLAGPKVREALAKLIPIDIHPRTFQAGAVAQTLCGYVNVMLWRLEDSGGDPTFEIWVGRSLAISLYQAISHSSAEFGFLRQGA